MSSRFQLPPKGMVGTIDITPRDPSDPEAMYSHLFHFDPYRVSEGAYQIIAVVRYQNLSTPLPLRGFPDTGIIDFMES